MEAEVFTVVLMEVVISAGSALKRDCVEKLQCVDGVLVCRVSMVERSSQALIAFPVSLKVETTDGLPCGREAVWLYLICKLLETKLMQKLRFEFGEVPRSPSLGEFISMLKFGVSCLPNAPLRLECLDSTYRYCIHSLK